MSAVSLCVSIGLRWGRWEEGEVGEVGKREGGKEGKKEGGREGGRKEGRWINELPKDTAVPETFPQAREKQTSGTSVLLARLGGHRGEAADDASPCLFLLETLPMTLKSSINVCLYESHFLFYSSHFTSPLSRVLLSSLLYCLFSALYHIHYTLPTAGTDSREAGTNVVAEDSWKGPLLCGE